MSYAPGFIQWRDRDNMNFRVKIQDSINLHSLKFATEKAENYKNLAFKNWEKVDFAEGSLRNSYNDALAHYNETKEKMDKFILQYLT